jgi:hypothetical protein
MSVGTGTLILTQPYPHSIYIYIYIYIIERERIYIYTGDLKVVPNYFGELVTLYISQISDHRKFWRVC